MELNPKKVVEDTLASKTSIKELADLFAKYPAVLLPVVNALREVLDSHKSLGMETRSALCKAIEALKTIAEKATTKEERQDITEKIFGICRMLREESREDKEWWRMMAYCLVIVAALAATVLMWFKDPERANKTFVAVKDSLLNIFNDTPSIT